MNKPTFYEQLGIVIPGAVLLVGLLFYFPALNALIAKDGVTLGQFGIFLLLSYAAGHFVAAIGNALETIFWSAFGGMPSDWVTRAGGTTLLNSDQTAALERKLQERLGITITVKTYDRKRWRPISRQIYADVAKNGKPDRIDTFNGNYGLMRGLTGSGLVLAVTALTHGQQQIALWLLALALVFGYRAYRFGTLYGRELYLQFLVTIDTKPPGAPKSAETKE